MFTAKLQPNYFGFVIVIISSFNCSSCIGCIVGIIIVICPALMLALYRSEQMG